jgi:hypothetical protein
VRAWRATVVALAAEQGLLEGAPPRLKSVPQLPIT